MDQSDWEYSDDQFYGYKVLLELWEKGAKTKRALRDALRAMNISATVDGLPWSGFYRLPKDGKIEPIAIFCDTDGQRYVYWGGKSAAVADVWPRCMWAPVPYDWYEAKVDRGEEWPDLHVFKTNWREDEDAPPPIGDNKPPASESDVVREEVATTRAGLKLYEKITSDDQAAAAQTLRSKLLELARRAENIREKLKRPHIDAGKAIDAELAPIRDSAQAGADQVRSAMKAWENVKFTKAQEEQAARDRVAEEAAETAEAAAFKARAEGTEPPPPPPPQPEVMPIAPVSTIKGATGRAAHVSTQRVIDSITDWDALFSYFREDGDVRRLLFEKASRQIKLNPLTEIPGVKTKDERQVA